MLFADIFNALPDTADPFLCSSTEALSFSEFKSAVRQQIRFYRTHNLHEGDLVCIGTGRGLRYFVDLVAAWMSDLCVVPFAYDLSDEHKTIIIETVKPRLILLNETVIVPQEDVPQEKNGKSAPGNPRAILFTSGTSGKPKGVSLTEQALIGNALASLERIDLQRGDKLFTSIPFQFTSLMSHFLAAFIRSACIHVDESRLMNKDFLDALRVSHANCFGGSPLQLLWLSQTENFFAKEFKWVMSSGDSLPLAVIEAMQQHYPRVSILTFYGITEVGGRFCSLPPQDIKTKAGSVGMPIRGLALTVRDENGALVAAGEIGEIFASGDYLLTEYLVNPSATAAALTEHGFKTGDMGYLDTDGYLYHMGRNDDVFKSGGQKISCLLIRNALLEIGCFADVAVVPTDFPGYGQVSKAYVVFKEGQAMKQGPILRELRKRLPANHIPREIAELTRIPRTGSGKVIRRELVS